MLCELREELGSGEVGAEGDVACVDELECGDAGEKLGCGGEVEDGVWADGDGAAVEEGAGPEVFGVGFAWSWSQCCFSQREHEGVPERSLPRMTADSICLASMASTKGVSSLDILCNNCSKFELWR